MNPLRWIANLFRPSYPNIERYRKLVDALRTARTQPGWKPEHDRPKLAKLEDLYNKLSAAEQEQVEAEGWRAWPEGKPAPASVASPAVFGDKPSRREPPTRREPSGPLPLPKLDGKALDAFYAVRNQCPKCNGKGSRPEIVLKRGTQGGLKGEVNYTRACPRCLGSGRYARISIPPSPRGRIQDPPCTDPGGHIWFAIDSGWLCSLCGRKTEP